MLKTGRIRRFAVLLLIVPAVLAVHQACALGAEEASLELTVRVIDRRERGHHYRGEPLSVRVTLGRLRSGTPQPDTSRLGTEKDPWFNHVAFYLYRIEERTTPDGTQAELVPVKQVPAKARYNRPGEQRLQAGQRISASWVVDHIFTSDLPAGRYCIEATFDTTARKESDPKLFRGKCQGKSATIVINEPKDNMARADVLRAQGDYLTYHEGHYDEAIKLYLKALKLAPGKGRVHCGLGRAYELKGDPDNAINEYRAYVQWVRSSKFPRTGEDDINDHADIIERQVKAMEERRTKAKK